MLRSLNILAVARSRSPNGWLVKAARLMVTELSLALCRESEEAREV